MTLETLKKRLAEHGYKTDDTGKALHYDKEGEPYPCFLVVIDKDGTYLRRSTSYQSHSRVWLEDIEAKGQEDALSVLRSEEGNVWAQMQGQDDTAMQLVS